MSYTVEVKMNEYLEYMRENCIDKDGIHEGVATGFIGAGESYAESILRIPEGRLYEVERGQSHFTSEAIAKFAVWMYDTRLGFPKGYPTNKLDEINKLLDFARTSPEFAAERILIEPNENIQAIIGCYNLN